jgi:hypothetical protein
MKRTTRSLICSSSLVAAWFTDSPLIAQIAPPEVKLKDNHYVDLYTEYLELYDDVLPPLSGGELGLGYTRYLFAGFSFVDTNRGFWSSPDMGVFSVVLGDKTHTFSTMYPAGDREADVFGYDAPSNDIIFIGRDGTKADFGSVGSQSQIIRYLLYTNGLRRDYYYKTSNSGVDRLQSIVQSDGTMLKYGYDSDDPASSALPWTHVSKVTLLNLSYVYCDPNAVSCSVSPGDWPSATISGPQSGCAPTGQTALETITTYTGNGKVYKRDATCRIVGISNIHPYTESVSFSYANTVQPPSYPTNFYVSAISQWKGETKTYQYPPLGSNVITIHSSTLNLNALATTASAGTNPVLASYQDMNGNVAKYQWSDPDAHITRIDHPDGNYETYSYDQRYNIIQKNYYPKPGSNLPPLTESAGYDSTCNNMATCNQPNYYVDRNGNRTDMTYTSFGSLASVMAPPAYPGAVRRVSLFHYAQKSAFVKNTAGQLVPTGYPFWVKTDETDCQTMAGGSTPVCDSAAPMQTTTFIYGPDGTADNTLVKGISVSDGGSTRLTCYTYDKWRHKVSETSPNAMLVTCP